MSCQLLISKSNRHTNANNLLNVNKNSMLRFYAGMWAGRMIPVSQELSCVAEVIPVRQELFLQVSIVQGLANLVLLEEGVEA